MNDFINQPDDEFMETSPEQGDNHLEPDPAEAVYAPENQEEPPTWDGQSQPQIENYDTIEAFEQDQGRWEKQSQMPPFFDDPNGAARAEADQWLKKCSIEEQMARDAGDLEAARTWSERARLTAKDLQDLGPTPEQEYNRELYENTRVQAAGMLFKPEMANDPVWDTERMQHDSAILLSQMNMDGQQHGLVLPLESQEFGAILPVRPGNVVRVELDPDDMSRYREHISGVDASSPEKLFIETWQWLREVGLHETGIRAVKDMPSVKSPADRAAALRAAGVSGAPAPIRPTGGTTGSHHRDPEGMSQADYEKWRRKSA